MSRKAGLNLARLAFLAAALWLGWWGLSDQWPDIVAAMQTVSPLGWVCAVSLVFGGLAVTSIVWTAILRGYGYRVAARQALSVFFVGQLGKYIPGSVWSLGAQAQMASRHRVPARTTVATGLIFLVVNVASAVALGSASSLTGALDIDLPSALAVLGIVAGFLVLTPPIVNRLGSELAGPAESLHLRWMTFLGLLGLMTLTWSLYGVGLILMVPSHVGGWSTIGLPAAIGAFAIAYVLGVLAVLAPSGLGVRDAALIYLLAPTVGVANAAAAALLTRAVHTLCDFAIALLAWIVGRASERTADSAEGVTHRSA